MEGNEGVAATSKGAPLLETLDLVTDVSNCSIFDYFARYERLLNVDRFVGMLLDGGSKTMVYRRGIGHDTDIGAWKRRWLLARQWCEGTIRPSRPF